MNSSTTDTALYVNLAITFLNFVVAIFTHMGWMKFQSSCCKNGTCCEFREEMGTEGTKPETSPTIVEEKKTE